MKKVYQSKFGNEGNCFAACIASILETELDSLPFLADYNDDWEDYLAALNEILKSRFNLFIDYTTYDYWESRFKDNFKDSFYIVSGDSNQEGFEHAVIFKNGVLHHNPNPNGTEMIQATTCYFFIQVHY